MADHEVETMKAIIILGAILGLRLYRAFPRRWPACAPIFSSGFLRSYRIRL